MASEYLTAFSVLIIMLGVMGITAWAVKRLGLVPGQPKRVGKEREITLIDSQTLDARNRLVVVKWREKSYLLGTGQNGVTLIASDAPAFGDVLAETEGTDNG